MSSKISVIIPAYNCEQYVDRAIESVLDQTYSNFEIIVIDDGSYDNTYQIATSYNDSRLKVIKNPKNLGVSISRNRGIEEASGSWISLLDADDWYSRTRLEKLLQAAQKHKAHLVADDLYLINDGDRNPWSTLLIEGKHHIVSPKAIDAVQFVESDRLNPINLGSNWSFGYIKPLIDRKFLLDRKIKYRENLKVGEDFTLYLECLLQQGKLLFVPQSYYFYRLRQSSLSDRTPTAYLQESCTIARQFIANKALKNNPQLLQAIEKNLVLFEERLSYYRFIESCKSKKMLDSIKEIILNPYLSKDVILKLLAILKPKINFILTKKKSSSPFKKNKFYSYR
ncbi:glycosyltransferase family 2 protein [Myxosarcina sp. GI1]|uniref:glycosyltransferase family 2 protein n=1 Tax=Myxosarcina sp. GI1 TaxID=1541065 RepID=UPI00055CC8AC|nr:glycosyltransferase family 2 protein [Myxosarcina sp. GI1]